MNALQDPASALVRARLARVIPETHKLAGHLLEEASRALPDSPIAWRERGGWWLGQQHEDHLLVVAPLRLIAKPRMILQAGSLLLC